MTDADKANVVAFYTETDILVDIPEHLVEQGDTVIEYLTSPTESGGSNESSN